MFRCKVPGFEQHCAWLRRLVQNTRDLGLYLIITIGNGSNNGDYNYRYAMDFWKFYAPRYANETHVLYEIHNEPVKWGPSYVTSQNPPGAMKLEVDGYNTIRQYAPNTPVLLFSYSQLSGAGAANNALSDIKSFNLSVFGNENATWSNIAVGFHGYAGAAPTATAVQNILAAGYPCFMTEFGADTWGGSQHGLDVALTADLERMGVSWLMFSYIPPWGFASDVTKPEAYKDRVENSGLSWVPDYGTWPLARSVFGNNGYAWTTANYSNNALSGTLRVEAENFDNGGKEVAYHNSYNYNPGGKYRTNETVGIENTADTGGGYDVGYLAAGDWMEYTLKVPVAGTYDLRLRVAGTGSGKVQVSAGDTDLTGSWILPGTGGYQTWATVTKSVLLPAGQHRLRISIVSAGFNLNWFEFSPATSGPLANGTYRFQNISSGQAMDLNANNKVTTNSSSTSTSQQWKFQHIGGGLYRVGAATNNWGWDLLGGSLSINGWWGASGDRCFLFLPTGSGSFRIVSSGSGRCLQPTTDNPPALKQQAYTGDTAQQWSIASVIPNGAYRIIARHSGKALSVGSAQTQNGTQAVQLTYAGGDNQKWTLTDLGSGLYSIIGVQSGRSLEVENSGTANGAKIQLQDYLGGANQKFTLTPTSGGYYRITPSHATNSCLDVFGVSTADGAKVHLWEWYTGNSQQWALQAP
jgi:endoglucanase